MKKTGRFQSNVAKKHGVLRIILILLLVLVLGIVGTVVWYYHHVLDLMGEAEYVEREASQEELEAILGPGYSADADIAANAGAAPESPVATKAPEKPAPGEVVNVMLVGQAYQEGEDSRLADSMILATLNFETKTLTLTSILRDTYIKLPDYAGHTCGKNKINTCYALGHVWGGSKGAMEMLDQLMLEQFGVNVDYNVEVDFDSFSEIVNALGGIEMELTQAEADYLNRRKLVTEAGEDSFTKGTFVLSGVAALEYARMRKADASDSDINPASRQRKILTKILEECRSINLLQMNDMINRILPMVVTDMPKDKITTYALKILPILTELKIVSNQCPAEGTYGGQIIEIYGYQQGCLIPDLEKNRELLTAITEWDVLNAAEK